MNHAVRVTAGRSYTIQQLLKIERVKKETQVDRSETCFSGNQVRDKKKRR
ncbi:MAG: hypothetical protein IKO68_13565 [Oscillospiraceae bacterium]|nr:hypothetical protein [Oscillospiraceae bacterium]